MVLAILESILFNFNQIRVQIPNNESSIQQNRSFVEILPVAVRIIGSFAMANVRNNGNQCHMIFVKWNINFR